MKKHIIKILLSLITVAMLIPVQAVCAETLEEQLNNF